MRIPTKRRAMFYNCQAEARGGACTFPAIERFEKRALCGTHLRIAKARAEERDRGWSPEYVAGCVERAIQQAKARGAKKCQPLLTLAEAERLVAVLRGA